MKGGQTIHDPDREARAANGGHSPPLKSLKSLPHREGFFADSENSKCRLGFEMSQGLELPVPLMNLSVLQTLQPIQAEVLHIK